MKPAITFLFFLFLTQAFLPEVLHAQNINTYAGNGYGAASDSGKYGGDGGAAAAANLYNPSGVATHDYSNVYIADQANHVIRMVNAGGTINTYAGKNMAGYSGDGGPADSCLFNRPFGIALDASENLYIADYVDNVVRKIDNSGIITTIAGNDTGGYSGDYGLAVNAKLLYPYAVAADNFGNIFIADAGNNVIRKVTAAGFIYTYAGNGFGAGMGLGHGSYSGDGGAAVSATLNCPKGVAVDVTGNVYIADSRNNVIRKVNTSGIISTLAGDGLPGYSGNGGSATAAQLNFPSSVATDGNYNVYFTDEANNVVRMVTDSGVISTIAGNGSGGFSGDGGPATAGELNSPYGVTIDGAGLIYIADAGNNRIRVVGNYTVNAVKSITSGSLAVNIFPNPSSGSFTIEVPCTGNDAVITITDVLGRQVETRNADNGSQKSTAVFSNYAAGNYFIKVEAGSRSFRGQVAVW